MLSLFCSKPAVDVVDGEHVVHPATGDQVPARWEGGGHHPGRLQGNHLHKHLLKWILMKQIVHLYLVACPAIPNNQFPVQRSANLPNSNFNRERIYIDCPRHWIIHWITILTICCGSPRVDCPRWSGSMSPKIFRFFSFRLSFLFAPFFYF